MKRAQLHDTLDLARHGVIEASAGTGKTYTIESLFVRLLCEPDPGLRAGVGEILVLTFTERATGELQVRIREKIRQKLGGGDADPGQRELLQAAHDGFDDASIFTIHGFCHRVLQQFPFETGQPFRQELADDRALYERALRGLMRGDWPNRYGDDLEEILLLSGYASGRGGGWEAAVLYLAARWRPEAGDRLLPEALEDFPGFLASCRRALEPALPDLRRRLLETRFLERFDRVGYSATFKQEVCVPLKAFLGAVLSGRSVVSSLLPMLSALSSRAHFRKKGFRFLLDKDYAGVFPAGELDALCEKLDALREALPDLPPADVLAGHLAVETVHALKRWAREHKNRGGLLSYDDMLIRLDRALRESDALARELRGRYRVALIDEFQDTDAVQWSILKRIFFQGEGRRLFLIGDPKQAIFGFRGADVTTYVAAREQVLAGGREPERLGANWRSVPALVRALNELFLPGAAGGQGRPGWFAPGDIAYVPVRPPPEDEINVQVVRDATGREPVTVMDLGGITAKGKAAKAVATWIAGEVRRLLAPEEETGEARLVFRCRRGDPARGLRPDDICVLVRGYKEVPALEEALTRQGVPHAYYKKPGLYQSPEADHLRYLFDAIARPADGQAFKKALLTPFFRVRVEELWTYEDLEPEHAIKTLLGSWHDLAGRRAWTRLFQSVLEDTGVMLSPGENTERRLANYQQILQTLETEARREHLDFVGICERLNRYRQRSVEMDEDVDIHRLETEKPRVQIVTIHKSKGLQWPVVFLGTGSGYGGVRRAHKYHDQERRTVYSLSGEGGAKERGRREEEEEDLRLYYVALTRAMFKLYVPCKRPVLTRTGQVDHREGPVGRFLCPAMMAAWLAGGGGGGSGACVPACEGVGVVPLLEEPDDPAHPAPAAAPVQPPGPACRVPDPPLPPDHRGLRERTDVLCSFSSLAGAAAGGRGALGEAAGAAAREAFRFTAGGAREKEPDEAAPGDAAAPAGEAASLLAHLPAADVPEGMLPRGAETGNALHEILERIDFGRVRRMDGWEGMLEPGTSVPELVRACLARHGLPERPAGGGGPLPSYAEQAARMVWNALHARFPVQGIPGKRFRLADLVNRAEVDDPARVPADHRVHELEFLVPLPASLPAEIAGTEAARWLREQGVRLRPDASRQGGYLAGFIDLVFRVRDEAGGGWRYCIVDWKSNWIPGGDYGRGAMEACMAEHGYTLQADLYTIALARWLRSAGVLPSSDPGEFGRRFGGVFYVFLRGVDPAREGQGIYTPPGPLDPARCERDLFLLLNREPGRADRRSPTP